MREISRLWTPEAQELQDRGFMPIAGGAADRDTVVYDVHDCWVYPLSADSGASPTYGTGVDVPGIASVGLDPNIVANVLKGDARVLDRRARIDEFSFSATYSKFSLDVLAVIFGTTVGDSGSGTGEVADVDIEGGNELPYFGIAFDIEDVDVGLDRLRVITYKTKLSGGTLISGATDAYGQPTFTAGAIATDAHNKMARFRLAENLADLTATFPG